jgi:hypothetical protein
MAGILKCDQVQSDSNLAFAIAGSNVAFMNATSLQMVGSNVSLAGTNVITNGKLVTAAQPVGAVLQVVQGVSTTATTISGGPTDTTLTATITPTSATSKILIIVNQLVYLYGGGGDSGFQLFILKNGSTIYNNIFHSLYIASSSGSPELITNYPITYLDSPATTSALTYKTQATATGGATPSFQWATNQSTITLMEIAA